MRKNLLLWLLVALGFSVLALLASYEQSEAQTAEMYVGTGRCKKCHAHQYQIWNAGPHRRATELLAKLHRQDKRCNQCHMTLSPTPYSDKKIEGITCERCHGAGRYYAFEYVMRDEELRKLTGLKMPNEQSCLMCHNDETPSVRKFYYDERWQEIDHSFLDTNTSVTADED